MKDILKDIYDKNVDFVKNENYKGFKKIIVDNYSDSAHFIYELLQNADDAQATEITFALKEDRLMITHNGILFSEDDLRGICSISMGTKADDYTKIGRFGIGFKSVFVYTNTPQIYSGKNEFEIEELILPKRIKCSFHKKGTDTVFVLPFNNPKSSAKAYTIIKDKLYEISDEALLFLSNLKKIDIIIGKWEKTIERIVIKERKFMEDSTCEEIEIVNSDNDEEKLSRYYRMKKDGITVMDTDEDGKKIEVDNQSVMIAFPIDMEYPEYKGLGTVSSFYYDVFNTYFVFFPTRIPTHQEYLIHAPFVTKSSRETLAQNNEANEQLMKNIGILAADSLIVLADMGKLTIKIIDKLFFEIKVQNKITQSFLDELKLLIERREKIIPCNDGDCRELRKVLFTQRLYDANRKIVKLFGKEWLASFYDVDEKWEFCNYDEDSGFQQFIHKNFDISISSVECLIEHIEKDEYESREAEWFGKFLELLVEKGLYGNFRETVNADLRKYPLVRLANHSHVCIGEAKGIYLNNGSLDEEVLESEAARYIYETIFKIKNYSVELEEARNSIQEIELNVDNTDFGRHEELLRKILIAINSKKMELKEIENEPLVYVENQKNHERRLVSPKLAMLWWWEKPNINLYNLFENIDVEIIDKRYKEHFINTDMKKLGCYEGIKEISCRSSWWQNKYLHSNWKNIYVHSTRNRSYKLDFQLANIEKVFDEDISMEKSVEIMKLTKYYMNQIKDWVEWSSRSDYSNAGSVYGKAEKYSVFGCTITEHRWIYGKDGKLYMPSEVTMEDIDSIYNRIVNVELCKKLGFREMLSEKIKAENVRLEKEGMYAIPLSDKSEYEEFQREKAKKQEEARIREEKRHSLQEEVDLSKMSELSRIENEFDDDEYNSVANKDRREAKLKEKINSADSNDKNDGEYQLTKKRKANPLEKSFLNTEYRGKCQVCGKRIKSKEDKNLFNAVNLISTSELKIEYRDAEYLGWNSLCLCPNCTAEYQRGRKSMKDFWKEVKYAQITNKSREPFQFDIMMQGENRKVTYSPKHLQNLKVALEVYGIKIE